jgi:hypothetical protein
VATESRSGRKEEAPIGPDEEALAAVEKARLTRAVSQAMTAVAH